MVLAKIHFQLLRGMPRHSVHLMKTSTAPMAHMRVLAIQANHHGTKAVKVNGMLHIPLHVFFPYKIV